MKEILLSQKYLEFEAKLIDEAQEVLNDADLTPKDLRALSAIFTELSKAGSRGKFLEHLVTNDTDLDSLLSGSVSIAETIRLARG